MSLVGYMRALGVRRGFRWWWVASRARQGAAVPPFVVHHGARPSMPGYRRRRSR